MGFLRIPVAVICLGALPAAALAQAVGVSPDGKKGRIHTVVKGDTLWDITETYIGSAWIWPSIWKENDIRNPHRIYPGEMIWITEGEMRKLTPEEAARFMRAAASSGGAPAAADRAAPAFAEPDTRPDPFAALDSSDSSVERFVEVKDLHRHAFVTAEEERGGGAVLGAHRPNYWSAQHQRTIVSLGEGQTQVGDLYTIYRVRRRLRHPETGEMLGYMVEVLGKGEVGEVHHEASFLDITASYAEIQPGDRIMRYTEEPERIREVFSDQAIEGEVVAHEPYRQRGARGDMVVLDRGTDDGVAAGRRFSLYRPGREVPDPVTLNPVLVPDDVIGEAFVVKSSPRASLAIVTTGTTEVLIGDRFRNAR